MRATIGHSLEGARWKIGLVSSINVFSRHEIYSRCEAVLSKVEETNVELISGLHDNPKVATDSKIATGSPANPSAQDRLELFFEGRRAWTGFRRSCCAGWYQRSELRSFAFSRLRRQTPDPLAFSGKRLPRRALVRVARPAAWHRAA
jgi:hypothetical protein